MAGAGFHHLKITSPKGHGHSSHVELDGQDVGGGLSGVDLHLHVDDVNSATLELIAPTFEVEGEFQVRLPEESQDLLKRLGWTPPG